MRKPDKLLPREIRRKLIQRNLQYDRVIRLVCMNRMHLVAVYNNKLSLRQMIVRRIKQKVQFPFLHREDFNGPVPMLLSDLFSVVSLKPKQFERKAFVCHDNFVLVLLLCHILHLRLRKKH